MSKSKLNIDRGFISKLLETKDIKTVRDLQINTSFLNGDSKVVFDYIITEQQESGAIPTQRVVESKYPNFELDVHEDGTVGNDEELQFWCSELRKRKQHNYLIDTVEDVADSLDSLDSESAYKRLKTAISYMETEVVISSTVDITKNTDERKTRYLERKEKKGIIGIPTGFDGLDSMTGGRENGTLTTVIATTGIGKTWLEVIIGVNCVLNNYTVLQLITEMSNDIMRDRYEALLYAKCYGEMNYNKFRKGALPSDVEKKFFTFLDEDLPKLEPLYIDNATSVSAIEPLIEKYNPDIILIDGAYLMEDDQQAKDDWLRVTHITRDLKKLAKRVNKPIIINTQADKNTSKRGPEVGSIMYSQAVGQDSDAIWGMFRDEVMINEHEMQLRLLKEREGVTAKLMLTWDFDTMSFDEIFHEREEQDEAEDKELEAKAIGVG